MHPIAVDRFFQSVDFGVVRDHVVAGVEIAVEETVGRTREHALGQAGHHEDVVTQGFEIGVEFADDVAGFWFRHLGKLDFPAL